MMKEVAHLVDTNDHQRWFARAGEELVVAPITTKFPDLLPRPKCAQVPNNDLWLYCPHTRDSY